MNFQKTVLALILLIIWSSLSCKKAREFNYKCHDHNVILITIDALRADNLPCYGYERNTAPNISELAKEGILFENAISQSSWTKPSMASLFTSLYPHNHKALGWEDALPDEAWTLAEELILNGYYTYAIQTNHFTKSTHSFNQGFNEYSDVGNEKANKVLDLFNQFLTDISKRSIKFFAYLHFMDVHVPYDAPKQHNSKFVDKSYNGILDKSKFNQVKDVRDGTLKLSKSDKKHMMDLYDAEINFVDDYIQKIFDKLKQLNLMDKTIIIITSDHGEEFWEHDGYEHGHTMYNELLRVPLIIINPKFRYQNKRIKQLVRLIDIFPTLMDILDIKTDIEFMGQNLARIMYSKEEKNLNLKAFSEAIIWGAEIKALQTSRFKLIKNIGENTSEFYCLDKDPEEKIDMFKNQNIKKTIKKFESLFDKYEKIKSKPYHRKQKEIDEATKRKLESLGYIKN